MQKLRHIWNKRQDWMNDKTWVGDDPRAGFVFPEDTQLNQYIKYSGDNWNDLMIHDLREFLNSLLDGFEYSDKPWINERHLDRGKVSIQADVIAEQTYVTIKMSDYGMYSASWYKRRGKIDSFLNLEYGESIDLQDVTELLYRLGLEDDYEIEDDE